MGLMGPMTFKATLLIQRIQLFDNAVHMMYVCMWQGGCVKVKFYVIQASLGAGCTAGLREYARAILMLSVLWTGFITVHSVMTGGYH